MRASRLELSRGVALAVLTFACANTAAAQVSQPVGSGPADQSVASQEVETSGDAQGEQDIVVTGTLIRGIAPVGTNVVGLSSADIVATGASSANQILARVPQVTSAFNQTPALSSGNAGLTVVRPNLRNLPAVGGSTTLVLIDGHRAVNAGVLQTSPDPDVIPPSVLERVDVMPDGGSSIYGSDAVGGVINFITRRRFDGIEANARYGFADEYHQFDANITAGEDWGSGSGYLSYAFVTHNEILGRDRDYVRQITPNTGRCAPGTVTITRPGAPATTTTYALPGRTPGTVSTCDATDNLSIFPREERHSIFGSLMQEVSDGVTFEVKGFYTRRETTHYYDFNSPNATFNGLAQSGTITQSTLTVPGNPYYVPIAPNDPGTQTVGFSYAGVFDNRGRVRLDEFGVTPTLTADLGGGWQFRALGNYGRSIVESHATNVDVVAQNAALAGTTLATALNPYDPGASNAAVLSSIFRENYNRAKQELINGRAIVDGSLATIGGGDIRLAAGVEYIRERFRSRVGIVVPGRENTAAQGIADRNVKSVFAELVVPVIGASNATSFAQSLTLSASGRYDHYSDFGDTFNPKVGLTFKPIDWFTIRGNYGTSFNAPSLADTAGAADTRVQVLDFSPWRAPGDPASEAARRTVLLAGGNVGLGPQKADTWSIGADLKPSMIEGLTLSATYYSISLKDQIAIIPFTSGIAYTSPAYAAFVTKNPTLAQLQAAAGSLPVAGAASLAALYAGGASPYVLFDARRQNLGQLKQDGIDFNVSYATDTSFGSINAGIGGTYTLSRRSAPVAGAAFIDALNSPGASRFGFVASLGGTVGGLTANATLTHSAGYDILPAVGTQTKVDAFDTVDLFFAYDLGQSGWLEDTSLTLNVGNLFDEDPSFYNQDPGYTNGSTLGRFVQIGIRKKF